MATAILALICGVGPWKLAQVEATPNLVVNGDLELPPGRAEPRIDSTENEVIFTFPGEKHFGRVIARGRYCGRPLSEQLGVGYVQGGNGRGLMIDATQVEFKDDYEISVWFDLKGSIRPNKEYVYTVFCLPTDQNKGVPPLEMIAPAIWADGKLTGATVNLTWETEEQTYDSFAKRGSVKTPDFKYQTGGQWLVLKLPKNFKDRLLLVRVSLRQIDEALLKGEESVMPAPTRYIVIDDILEEQIDQALTRGTEALQELLVQQQGYLNTGNVEESVELTATVLSALAERRVDMTTREMRKGIDWLASQEIQTTNALSSRISFLSRHAADDHRQAIAGDLLKLADCQYEDGGWAESCAEEAKKNRTIHPDNLHSYAAIEGLRAAYYAGFKTDLRLWRKAAAYWRDAQAHDGGYRAVKDEYGGLGEATTTYNTALGLAGLLITLDMSYAADARYCTQYLTSTEHLESLNESLEWMQEYYDEYYKMLATLESQPNPLVNAGSMESLIELLGIREFRDKDVFRTEAERLVRYFDPASGLYGGSIQASAYVTFMLNRGAAPIAFQRVVVGGNPDFQFSRDGDHLMQYLRQQRRQPFNWRIADIGESVQDLLIVPIMYVHVAGQMDWKEEHWKKLRDYCFGGGAVLFNVAEDNASERPKIEEGLKIAFPEYQIHDLGKDDPIFSTEHKLENMEGIKAVGNGFKNFVFITPEDWSCRLNTFQIKEYPATFQFFNNLLSYTLDKERPRSSFAPSTWVRGTATTMDVRVARMEVGSDRPAFPDVMKTLDRIMSADYRLNVEAVPAEKPHDEGRLLWVACTGDRPLTDDEKRIMNAWIDKGAFLFAEVVSGKPAWAESFRAELQKLDGDIRIRKLVANHPLLTGQLYETFGYDLRVVKLRQALREEYKKLPRMEVYVIEKDGRDVGAFSVHDVSSGLGYVLYPECRGLMPASSREFATNLVLYAMQRALLM